MRSDSEELALAMGNLQGVGSPTVLRLAFLTLLATLASVPALVLAAAVPTADASVSAKSTTTTAPHGSKLVQVGLEAFWECPSKTTRLLIAVNTLTLHHGSNLHINFIVRNQSHKACSYVAPYASVAPGPTSTTLSAGPCGSIGFEILGRSHRNVWPGSQTLNCPALGFAQLQPGATVSGNGTWNQEKANSSSRVAAGSYTLVVGGRYKFPLRISRS